MDERKRDSIIAYLRSRMAEFGITESALAEALAEAPAQAAPIPLEDQRHGRKRTMPQMPSMPVGGAAQARRPRSGMRAAIHGTASGRHARMAQACGSCGQDIEFYRV